MLDEKRQRENSTIWTNYGSAMKYFRWTNDQIMNMSYDNYNMYLASIPRHDTDDENPNSGITGSRDLFDFDKR